MKKLIIPFFALVLLCACGGGQTSTGGKTQTTNEMNSEIITLVAAEETGATMLDALKNRASVRDYTSEGLTLDELSGVLWATAGQNRADGHLTAPTAMGLYPIRTYAVISGGIYLYDAPSHSLSLVKAGDFRTLTGLQDFVYTAPLNIVYVADLAKYGERAAAMTEQQIMFLCAMDAAGYCQNANLWAAANGLGAVTRAGAKAAEFLAAIEAPETYRFVLAQTIGVPAN